MFLSVVAVLYDASVIGGVLCEGGSCDGAEGFPVEGVAVIFLIVEFVVELVVDVVYSVTLEVFVVAVALVTDGLEAFV